MVKKVFELINKNLLNFNLNLFKKSKKKIVLPVITISREMGSGGRPIAYLVAKKLGNKWRVYHKEIIDQIAKKSRLEKELIKEIDEKNIPIIDKMIATAFGKKYPSLSTYYKHLVRIISEISQRGYAIIIGRGAEFIIPYALNVRIICEMAQRIKWEMEFEGLTKTQAIERIKKSDEERVDFIKSLYHHDPRKAHHYDLVIRTGPNLSIEDAAEIIVLAAKRRFGI